jgi:hypothetical protein
MPTRAELTGPRPPGVPDGECIVTRLDSRRLRIDRADPRILISAELLESVRDDEMVPGVSLREAIRSSRSGPIGIGSVLRIEAVNRTVIYQITYYVRSVHGYVGQWPD